MFRSIQKKIRSRVQRVAMQAITLYGAYTYRDKSKKATPNGIAVMGPGREAALAWMKRSFQLEVVSSLPRDEKGNIIWKLAGPMMFRELPLTTFALIYATGLDEAQAEILAKQILNEWHGLDPNAGGDFGPGDLKEAK